MLKKEMKISILAISALLGLAACGANETQSSVDSNTNQSQAGNTDPISGDSVSESQPNSESQISLSKPDYTEGWSALPALGEEITNYCGGNAIPFIDLQGDFKAVNVKKSGGIAAHLLIYTTGSYDRTLVYNTKTTYELAGWDVTYNQVYFEDGRTPTWTLDAIEEDLGIQLKMYGKQNTRDNSQIPYLEIYFEETFKIPPSRSWNDSTKEVLASVNIQAPHALPYCYLGVYKEEADVAPGNKVKIKGGDWSSHERDITNAVRNNYLTAARQWTYSKSTSKQNKSGVQTYVYTYSKTFSDNYKITADVYGTYDPNESSLPTADRTIYCYMEVTLTSPKK